MIDRALEIEEIDSCLFLFLIYSVIIASINFDRINDALINNAKNWLHKINLRLKTYFLKNLCYGKVARIFDWNCFTGFNRDWNLTWTIITYVYLLLCIERDRIYDTLSWRLLSFKDKKNACRIYVLPMFMSYSLLLIAQ